MKGSLLEIRKDRKVSPQVELMKICTTLVTANSDRTKATSSIEEDHPESAFIGSMAATSKARSFKELKLISKRRL